jgi:hypothetical protein
LRPDWANVRLLGGFVCREIFKITEVAHAFVATYLQIYGYFQFQCISIGPMKLKLVVMDTFRYLVPGTVVQKCLKNIMGFFNE